MNKVDVLRKYAPTPHSDQSLLAKWRAVFEVAISWYWKADVLKLVWWYSSPMDSFISVLHRIKKKLRNALSQPSRQQVQQLCLSHHLTRAEGGEML